MRGIFNKWVDRGASLLTYWQILVPASVVGIVTGLLSTTVAEISRYGAFGWWVVGLAAFGFSTAALFIASLTREKWVYAGIARDRAKAGDPINPIDREFHRQRIKLADLVRPSTNYIRDKIFTDCQLIGPMIVHMDGCDISGAGFINCNWVVCREDARIYSAINMKNCVIRGGDLSELTIVVGISHIDFIRNLPIVPISITGDPEIDTRKPAATYERRHQA